MLIDFKNHNPSELLLPRPPILSTYPARWDGFVGFWPGTSYGFIGDPVLGDFPEPQIGGITIYPNVIASVITIAIAIAGYWLINQVNKPGKTNQPLAVKDS